MIWGRQQDFDPAILMAWVPFAEHVSLLQRQQKVPMRQKRYILQVFFMKSPLIAQLIR